MRNDEIMIRGYLAGYMNKEAADAPMLQAPQQQPPPMAGQGMGQGIPAQGPGFPANPEMVANEEDQAAQQEETARQQKLDDMKAEVDELKYAGKEQKLTGDLYKEKMKLKTQGDKIKQDLAAQQNDTSLSGMIGNTSPGE